MAQKRKSRGDDGDLFIEGSGQLRLVDKSAEQQALEKGKVECLGMTFDSEDARRAYFTDRLREKLADPEFRKTPGFPKGTDEDIVRMSDPPWYTVCPNPFIEQFLSITQPTKNDGVRSLEPFTTDVSEGKNDPIYNAHSYHTKVPHQAIQTYINHYTVPGDVVLDCFCGTGMTGVACAELHASRRCIQIDLSPAATAIAYNYSAQKDRQADYARTRAVLRAIEDEFAWAYRTRHTGWKSADRAVRRDVKENIGNSKEYGTVQFVLWSDVFLCPHCSGEIVFWFEAADEQIASLKDSFPCRHCNATINKDSLDRVWTTFQDEALQAPAKASKRVPVLIQYEFNDKTFHKIPDEEDIALVAKTDAIKISDWYPTAELPHGDKTADPRSVGITHAHHFYTRRNLAVMAALWKQVLECPIEHRPALEFLFTSTNAWTTRMNRLLVSNFFKKRGGVIGQTLAGTLYVSSVSIETNPLYRLSLREASAAHTASSREVVTSTQSATSLSNIPSSSIDYVFVDPPFGHNIVYSDLNFLWEAWIAIITNSLDEAIVSRAQKKTLVEYERLMRDAFAELFRVLKPGRWITVEFHNSQNAVWRAIQEALGQAGFVVADVSILEKTHGTFNQVTAAGAVKKDLAINAYKPPEALENAFALHPGSAGAAWEFVGEYLRRLPIARESQSAIRPIVERQPHHLFDQVIAFHVRRNTALPFSAGDFYLALEQRFVERDGMFFLNDQAAEYDRKRLKYSELQQLSLFVIDEASAIQWLRQELSVRPRSFQDLQPVFLKEAQNWARHEKTVELRDILRLNFIHYDGSGPVPSQIHSYLSTNFKELRNLAKDDSALTAKAADRWYVPDPGKQGDLEKLREKALLTEFETYKHAKERKLKLFRTEAVRAGFKAAYEGQDYKTIVIVAAKLPENVLQEDEKLLMYYDVASMRLGDE
jgi:DNA modification methylase